METRFVSVKFADGNSVRAPVPVIVSSTEGGAVSEEESWPVVALAFVTTILSKEWFSDDKGNMHRSAHVVSVYGKDPKQNLGARTQSSVRTY